MARSGLATVIASPGGRQAGGVAGQPLAEELEQLGELGRVDDGQFHIRRRGYQARARTSHNWRVQAKDRLSGIAP
jgi:hypothetical protein